MLIIIFYLLQEKILKQRVPKDSGLNVSLIRNKITAINRDKLRVLNVNIDTVFLYILLKCIFNR